MAEIPAIKTESFLGGMLTDDGQYALLKFAEAEHGGLTVAMPAAELLKLCYTSMSLTGKQPPLVPGKPANLQPTQVDWWTYSVAPNGDALLTFDPPGGGRFAFLLGPSGRVAFEEVVATQGGNLAAPSPAGAKN
jgi:hypothetical protein